MNQFPLDQDNLSHPDNSIPANSTEVEYPTDGKPKQCLWMTNGQICMEVFSDSDELASHLKECHTPTSKKNYICYWKDCKREQKTFGLRRHLLIDHIRTHTGERPFACETCHAPFITQGSLRRHKRIHTGEHTHSGCYERFSTTSIRQRHMLVHQDDKNYHCQFPYCGKSYKSRNSLRRHQIKNHPMTPDGDSYDQYVQQFENTYIAQTSNPENYQEELYDDTHQDPSFQLDTDENEFVVQDGSSSADESQNFRDDETFSDSSGMLAFKKNPTKLCQDTYVQPDPHTTACEYLETSSTYLSNAYQEYQNQWIQNQCFRNVAFGTSAYPYCNRVDQADVTYPGQYFRQFQYDSGAPTWITTPQDDYRKDPIYQISDQHQNLTQFTNQHCGNASTPVLISQNIQNPIEESIRTPNQNNTDDDPIDPLEIWQYFYPPT